MPGRTSKEIRASIEQNRQELGTSLETLRGEVARITDWRGQIRRQRTQIVLVAASVAGFVLGWRYRRAQRAGVRRRPRRRKAVAR